MRPSGTAARDWCFRCLHAFPRGLACPLVALVALVACGTVGRAPGEAVNASGPDGSASTAGTDAAPDDRADVADGASQDVSTTPDPTIAMMLPTLVPGACPASHGAIVTATLDGKDLSGLPWTYNMNGAAMLFASHWFAARNDSDVGFSVSFPFPGPTIGTWNAPALGVMVQFFGEPTFTCDALLATGAVRITSIIQPDGSASAQVCGAYDVDCADAATGHHAHLVGTFNDSVTINSGFGK